MAKRKKPSGRSQEAIKRAAKRQQERSGVLYLRIPRALHRGLKQAAQADHRTLADWMRLNLHRLLEPTALYINNYMPDLADVPDGPLPEAYERKYGISRTGKPQRVGKSSDPTTGEPK